METENADMREELSAFDPAFFDEIEDLKYDHHQLQLQCTEYESIVRELFAPLGIDAAVLANVAGQYVTISGQVRPLGLQQKSASVVTTSHGLQTINAHNVCK